MTDQGYLYAAVEITGEALTEFARQFSAKWVYTESETAPQGAFAVNLDNTLSRPVTAYRAGHLFDPRYDFRWTEVAEDRFDVQLLTEEPLLANNAFGNPQGFLCVASTYYLWGTHVSELAEANRQYVRGLQPNQNVWIETRIPRPLRYPITGNEAKARVQLHVFHYLQDQTIVITRWRALGGKES